ncbi:MAG: hypothetical protein QOC77_1561 [Thermoleophilaceae bacterium]|jgi:hypothetical protein|nr:hypothetical protein [Thermoleophilaceae bacterium]MEA2471054.1 hypothetical protein [Thermoleophilaceae bacterium]
MKSGWTRGCLLCFAGAIFVAGCGGGKKFENNARPAVPVQLTGVITDKEVTISPKRVGAGPVILNVSNQAKGAHTVTLEGVGTTDTVGPVNPLDTAQLQQTLKPGTYTVKAGSKQATSAVIKPFRLTVGQARASSSNQLLLP